jgi:hypothetical protein
LRSKTTVATIAVSKAAANDDAASGAAPESARIVNEALRQTKRQR